VGSVLYYFYCSNACRFYDSNFLRLLLFFCHVTGRLPPPLKVTMLSNRINLAQGGEILLDKRLDVQKKCDKLSHAARAENRINPP